jgi:chorismate-pyruvate lyase
MGTVSVLNSLARELVGLQSSTTLFLEQHRGMTLKVIIKDQSENNGIIKRVVLLFFETPGNPVLYCISYLDRQHLTDEEYYLLTQTSTPIGRIIISQNTGSYFAKKNIATQLTINEEAASFLHVESMLLYEKKYDYYVNQRRIGQIIEVFNDESLART